ncbi:MAG: DUF6691 family protein [Tabrizicola sp.]|uniref:DUF6691 family protein n=1 Tax=Tabrizicola sp. TaxID=2005166 RepID=UPI002735B4E1|nr:DUF6691 family protein [Tabrizicola sp.]MDP3261724.1 YeeE/YedE family protein [Tabrizicola sp.]MDP3648206.1 YeeE/YedE family protein [Paracoccaceae bacterium]MDZ4069029.1 DUF6691 family protein [Tabrizicola sp.]
MQILIQFALGLLFGAGLIVAGMADPAKVLNFLDVAAIGTTWDASLMFVLGGAIAVTFLGYRLVLKRPAPQMASQFHLPAPAPIDASILIGPAIFGVGWGLVGLCPGPAFVALGAGNVEAALFTAAMLAGMWGARLLSLRAAALQRA